MDVNSKSTVVPFIGHGTQATVKHFKVMSREQILEEKEIEWMVAGILPQDSFGELFGEPDAFKTFCAVNFGFFGGDGETLSRRL